MNQFNLDPRLEADTIKVTDLDMCELRLMDDARWPWIILIPRIDNALEWHELFTDQRQDVDFEITHAAAILKSITQCEKINIASLGNIVRQLHIHIIARNEGDENWPGPVWGFGERQPYDINNAKVLIEHIRREMDV